MPVFQFHERCFHSARNFAPNLRKCPKFHSGQGTGRPISKKSLLLKMMSKQALMKMAWSPWESMIFSLTKRVWTHKPQFILAAVLWWMATLKKEKTPEEKKKLFYPRVLYFLVVTVQQKLILPSAKNCFAGMPLHAKSVLHPALQNLF